MKHFSAGFLWLVAISLVGFAVRLFAAGRVGFGDSEALYACYALHPQPAYLDHPALVGLLARALGHGTSPSAPVAHAFTAAIATLAPWLVVWASRSTGATSRASCVAGLGVAVVPEIAVGLFAMTPDLLLFVGWVTALGCATLALRAPPSSSRAAAAFVAAGLAAGIACAAKVSAGVLMFALVVTYLSRATRAHARTVWPWVGLLSGTLVVLPVLVFEAKAGWPMLRHRLIDTQHDAGLSFRNAGAAVAGQAAYLSPVLAIAAAALVRDVWRKRQRDAVARLLAWTTVLPLMVLAPLCLWSRVAEPHWLAPAFLALPLHFAREAGEGVGVLSRRFVTVGVVTAGAISVLVHVGALTPLAPSLMGGSYDPRLDIANELYGWPSVVDVVRQIAEDERVPGGEDVVAVGPHWVICAQLHAALRGDVNVGCLDPSRNDFDTWNPPARWQSAGTVIFVTDNRFESQAATLFPDREIVSRLPIPVVRGGKVTRLFAVTVLRSRATAGGTVEGETAGAKGAHAVAI